jgi:phosphoserine phosphatase RsbU/P
MNARWRQFRRFVNHYGLVPTSRLAKFAMYLAGVDLFLIVYQWVIIKLRGPGATSVGGWILFLSYLSVFLFVIVAFRWVRKRLMWALRNRLIVTYFFVGVIPVVLLVAMGALIVYLFVGQFATYVASSDLQTEIRRLDAVNQRLASEIATVLRKGKPITPDILQNANVHEEPFPNRTVTAWFKGRAYVLATSAERPSNTMPGPAPMPKEGHENVVTLALDNTGASLRAARQLQVGNEKLEVISNVPLDRDLMAKVAERIGVVSMEPFRRASGKNQNQSNGRRLRINASNEELDLEQQTDSSGRPSNIESPTPLPPAKSWFDKEVTFLATVPALDWEQGTGATVLMVVRTRASLMYDRLFRTVGQFVNAVLYVLAAVAIFFGIIELIALIIGVRLTRTITASVYKLYHATQHIHQGDFSHRIHVTTNDQLASLETSFNSMTENIQRLMIEQKEKQRLENELTIAQEVQAQLFPKGVFDVQSLELYGFCAPARTVSGDYYDFIPLGPDRLALAVGDISGKGISAALLMATIHSAVRAYSLERAPMMATAGVGSGGSFALSKMEESGCEPDISPSWLCSMLNRQVYRSTPLEKYATMFLGIYDGTTRKLNFCNAGHLPPIIMAADGSVRRLDVGGSVIGLLEGLSFEEASATLRPGDLFIAYSDGITEPENEFGEFGEERLLQLICENQSLGLQRICDLVVAAVKDWIGGEEQPDDITLVLARLR